MKIQLSFALFLYLLQCSLADFTEEPDDICDRVLPGKYCVPDLSGWHDCHVDPSTGKMVDKMHSCPANTRCACFSGPACPGSLNDPCQPYRSLPPIPTEFTLYYKGVYTECSPAGCNDSYFSGREVQTLAEHKKRDDVFGRSSTFVLPDNGSGFNQTQVLWNKQKCSTQLLKTFPGNQILPLFLSYNGTVRIGHRLCEQWIWKNEEHFAGAGTSLYAYYITNQTSVDQNRYPAVSGVGADLYVPVRMEIFSNTGPAGKTSTKRVVNITSFVIGEVDKQLLELPSFC